MSEMAIEHRLRAGRLAAVEEGVFAICPVDEESDWGRWMGATLTAPWTVLSHASAGAAWGFWTLPRDFETVTRPGNGGPRRHGGILVHRSRTLKDDVDELRGIPITGVPRTLLDLAASRAVGDRAVARALREAIRLTDVSLLALGDALGGYKGRRGAGRLAATVAHYAGLPLERARSGAEIRAMEILRDARFPLPRLNHRIAGEEADLSWPDRRLIVEVDGRPFHQDIGEDRRKRAVWENAGWTVRRISSDEVYEQPGRLLTLLAGERP
jgi:very-short-patch-repair endonuclease